MLKHFNDDQKNNLAYTGHLIKGVSHNINTPLSAIMGRTEMLKLRLDRVLQQVDDPGQQEEIEKCLRDVGLILDNSNRVSSIVKNAMYKSIAAEHGERQTINLANLLREELEFLMADMEFKHNIEKDYQFEGSVSNVSGVYSHFSNSFIELIENAKEALRDTEDKKITISMHADEKRIAIAIGDNGCGMDEQACRSAMKRLAHTDDAAGEPTSGLAYVGRLLRPYHAEFTVTSRPGDTKIAIELPL